MRLSGLPIFQYANVLIQNARTLDRRFRITSLYRSPASQRKLYEAWLKRGKTGLPVAAPGHSFHELGQAVDIARGVDPFKDDLLEYLGAWWKEAGLGWSPHDPVHFQIQPIPVHAAGAASGAMMVRRAPIPTGARDAPIHHPGDTRGLTMDDGGGTPRLPTDRLGGLDVSSAGIGTVTNLAKGAGAAALASLAAGGGFAGAASAAETALAAAPEAAPLAVAGLISAIIAEHFGDLVSGQIDPYFDVTKASAAQKAANAREMNASLALQNDKYGWKGGPFQKTFMPGVG